jgi:hypothetical protein
VNTIARLGAVAVTALAAGTLGACHHAKAPTDAQLTTLLRVQTAPPNDPAARIDPSAVDCLRAWSGDAELAKPLPPAAASEPVKKACRQRLDGWIADASRNPDKLAFEDVSAPPAVRQAIALLQQHRATAAMPARTDQPPAMMMHPNPGAPAPAPVLPKGPVDVSAATAELNELDGLCKQAKDAAAASSNMPIARYAPMCDRRIAQLRERVNQLSTNGGTTREAEMLSDNVHRMLVFGRQLATAKAPTAPANPPPAPAKKN